MAENWNLADEFIPQLDKKVSVFDSMPSQIEEQRTEEWVNQANKKGWREHPVADLTNMKNLNEPVAEGMANTGNAPLSPSHPADQAAKGITNPLETFEPVNKESTSFGDVKERPEGSNEQQKKEPSFGTVISAGMVALQRIKDVSNGRSGRNKAFEQGRDQAFSQEVYDSMVSHLDARGFNVNDIAVVAKKPGGGYRSAQEIDQIRSFFDTGIQVKDENGNSQTVFPRSYEEAINMHQHESAQRMTDAKPAMVKDQNKAIGEAQANVKQAQDIVSNDPSPENRAALAVARENLNAASGGRIQQEMFNDRQNTGLQLASVVYGSVGGGKNGADGKPTVGVSPTASQSMNDMFNNGELPTFDARSETLKADMERAFGGAVPKNAIYRLRGDKGQVTQVHLRDGGPVTFPVADKKKTPEDQNVIPEGGAALIPETPAPDDVVLKALALVKTKAKDEAKSIVAGIKNQFSGDGRIKELRAMIKRDEEDLSKYPNDLALQRTLTRRRNESAKLLNETLKDQQNRAAKAASKSK